MTNGWFPVYRSIYRPGHWLAPTKRDPANRRDAWCYLISMATHTERETARSGILERGEFVSSLRTMGEHLCWSKDRVKRFMSDLETRTAIETVRETPDGTVYHIVNYDTYAVGWDRERDTQRDRERDTNETEARQEQEGKKEKRTTLTSDFEEVWEVCRRGSKKKALAQYRRVVPEKIEHDDLLSAWKSIVSGASDERYVPHLFRWIRDQRWEEDLPSTNSDRGSMPIRGFYKQGQGAR